MATVYQQFEPGSAIMLASAFPQLTKWNGTNYPILTLAYDAATAEAAFWIARAVNYGSGNLTLDLDWYADTATTGNVIWGVQLAVITPDTDTQNIETDALATASTVTDSHLGTTGQRLHRATITASNLDSLANNDWFIFRLYRDAAAGGDTMTGDALLTLVTLSYSDT